MNQREKFKWEEMRAKGMVHFVLVSGVLKLGGALFLTVSIIGNLLFYRQLVAEDLVSEGIVCLVGGFVGGACVWLVNEMRYWWSP